MENTKERIRDILYKPQKFIHIKYNVILGRMKMSSTLSHIDGKSWKSYSDKIEIL
jgi:hypothetical protein